MKEGIYLGKMQLKFGNWIYPRLAMTMYWWCGIKTGLVISIDDVITQKVAATTLIKEFLNKVVDCEQEIRGTEVLTDFALL